MSTHLLQDETLASKFIRRGMWGYIFMLGIAPIGYLVRLLVTNTLSVEEIGILYAVIGFITLLAAYNDLGLTEALQYFAPKYWLKKQHNELTTIIWLTLGAQLVTGSIIGGLLRGYSDLIATTLFTSPLASPIIQIYAWYFLAINIVQAFSSLLQAFQDTFTGQGLEFIRNICLITMIAGLRRSRDLTVMSFSRSQLTAQVIAGILGSIVIMTMYRAVVFGGRIIISRSLIQTQLSYAWRVFLGINMMILFGQIDLQMVLWFNGQAQAGYYTTYQSLLGLSIMLISPILNLLFATTTELHTKQDEQKLGHYLRFMSQYLGLFGMIVGGLFAIMGPTLASILYGSKMMYSGELLRVSSLFVPIIIVLSYWGLVMGGIGAAKIRGRLFGHAVVINIILNSILLPWLGSPGAIIATGCSRSYLLVMFGRHIYRQHRFELDRGLLINNALMISIWSLMIWVAMSYRPLIIQDDVPTRLYNLSIVAGWTLIYLVGIAWYNKPLVIELICQVQSQLGLTWFSGKDQRRGV